MSLKLNEIVIDQNAQITPVNLTEKQQKANQVKTLGIVSFILAVVGVFIPVIGFFMLIAAWLMSRSALKTANDYLVSEADDKLARWANVISKVFLIFSAIGLVLIILNSF